MNYAIISNGVVTNIIVGPLPDGMEGVLVDGLNVAIGDAYENGMFIRAVTTSVDQQIAELEAQIAALKAQL